MNDYSFRHNGGRFELVHNCSDDSRSLHVLGSRATLVVIDYRLEFRKPDGTFIGWLHSINNQWTFEFCDGRPAFVTKYDNHDYNWYKLLQAEGEACEHLLELGLIDPAVAQ